MNEPRRLREEGSNPFECALLEAGADYRSSPEARVKTLAALGLAGTAALTVAGLAGSSTALGSLPPAAGGGLASSSLLAKLGWAKILAALSAVGAATAIPVGYSLWKGDVATPPETPAEVARAAGARKAGTPSRAVAPSVEASEPSESVPPEEPAAPVVPKAPNQRTKPAAKTPSAAALSGELASLDAARGKLAQGDGAGALALLDAYGRAHPDARMKLEAEVLRIDALARSGQRAAAKKRAEAFLARNPNSVLASRVRTYLNE